MAGILVSPEVKFRSNIGQFISRIEAGGEAALQEIEALMEANLQAEAPRVTGFLASRTHAHKRGFSVIGKTVGVPYAGGVHDGNPPHRINSGDGGPLAQSWGKSKTPNDPGFFASSGQVEHPGNQPYPYLKMAYQLTWPHAMNIVDANID